MVGSPRHPPVQGADPSGARHPCRRFGPRDGPGRAWPTPAERFGVQDDRYSAGAKADRPGLHLRMAESTAELRTAELLIDDTVQLLLTAAQGADSKPLRAKAKYQATYSIELSRRAIARVANGAGGRALFDNSRLQRCLRDVTMASQHAVPMSTPSARPTGAPCSARAPATIRSDRAA